MSVWYSDLDRLFFTAVITIILFGTDVKTKAIIIIVVLTVPYSGRLDPFVDGMSRCEVVVRETARRSHSGRYLEQPETHIPENRRPRPRVCVTTTRIHLSHTATSGHRGDVTLWGSVVHFLKQVNYRAKLS